MPKPKNRRAGRTQTTSARFRPEAALQFITSTLDKIQKIQQDSLLRKNKEFAKEVLCVLETSAAKITTALTEKDQLSLLNYLGMLAFTGFHQELNEDTAAALSEEASRANDLLFFRSSLEGLKNTIEGAKDRGAESVAIPMSIVQKMHNLLNL